MNRRKILFVDDNLEFLQVIKALMVQMSDGTWEVLLAEGAGPALALLQQQPVDLVVVDVEMPVVDGIQFLQLLQRKYPTLARTALTGEATEARRAACLSAGAEICFQKPISPDQCKQLYAALNELARPHAEEGFRGVLRRVGLNDVIQMECLARNSSVLEVTSANVRGEIYIRSGRIIHAWAGTLKGEDAFYHLLSQSGGQFNLQPFVPPAEETIQGSWEFLVMEAARKQDEARERALEEQPPSAPPPPKTEARAVLEAPSLTSYLPGEREAAPAALALPAASRIEEVLLCSGQGEVLYEWQCGRTEARIGLLEFISQKAWQLSVHLPVGHFERLEFHGDHGRVVAQIRSDRGLFVRSAQDAPLAAPA